MDMHTANYKAQLEASGWLPSTGPGTSETESPMRARAFSFTAPTRSIGKAVDEHLVNQDMKEFLNITDAQLILVSSFVSTRLKTVPCIERFKSSAVWLTDVSTSRLSSSGAFQFPWWIVLLKTQVPVLRPEFRFQRNIRGEAFVGPGEPSTMS